MLIGIATRCRNISELYDRVAEKWPRRRSIPALIAATEVADESPPRCRA
jgi:hypothetical protein